MDTETYPQPALVEEEPRYLRRQKPVEIRRHKFGRKAWAGYLRAALTIAAASAGGWLLFELGHFLLTSPEMALARPEQIEIDGNHYVPRPSALEIFAADLGHSVLWIPLEQRRKQLEAIPWVEQAIVRRALPDRIEVKLIERTPVAFLRAGTELALVDAHGVILDRPLEGDFHFPVVAGITAQMTSEERARRMQMFTEFMEQIEAARAGAGEAVSEVDLSDANDLRAVLVGLGRWQGANADGSAGAGTDEPVLVRFGDSGFERKFEVLVDSLGQWRAAAGQVESVDLRFRQEAVVNPASGPRRRVDSASPRGDSTVGSGKRPMARRGR